MKFTIHGADARTGKDRTITLDAPSMVGQESAWSANEIDDFIPADWRAN